MAVNYFGAVRMVLALLPHWRERRFGHVVNVSSAGAQARNPQYSAYNPSKAALDALGPRPNPPLEPLLVCGEPTFEGLCKLLAVGWPSVGIFAAEGGQFIGGHGMADDAKLRTAAGLSALWDGEPIKRVRALGIGHAEALDGDVEVFQDLLDGGFGNVAGTALNARGGGKGNTHGINALQTGRLPSVYAALLEEV